MIIGLTIHDNDFQSLVQSFANQLMEKGLILEQPSNDTASDWYHWYMKTDQLTRGALKEPVSEASQDTIKRSWDYYVKNHESAAYLTGNLEVTLPESIDDTWQNGEQFYLFPTSYSNKVLCL